MKKIILPLVSGIVGGGMVLAAGLLFSDRKQPAAATVRQDVKRVGVSAPPAPAIDGAAHRKPAVIYGQGYLRGRSMTTLKNKYAGFVKKVYFYSGAKVKKGDVILEYDDLDHRVKITKAENEIAELEKQLTLEEIKLQLTRLDPLPSDYRNLSWKSSRAKELMERTENEWQVYRRLSKNKSVSELDLREKKQAYYDAKAAYQTYISDQEKVSQGMEKLYIQEAEREFELLKTKLANRKKELELLKEELKYYKIVAPYDGITETNSDTVHAWNASGTSAASVHRVDRYYIYSYFEESVLPFVKDGMKGRFYHLQNGEYYDLQLFEITRSKTVYGDKVYHLFKCRVLSPIPEKLRLENPVIVEFKLQ